ncbi:MAG: hypothetical protein JO092_05150 [Candidatus Eremiobacteraeota bacterium]|nr:hypothetical protein [Candidatus Eremiobacteraeota bacterium]
MVRYLLISTAIVLTIAVTVASWTNRDLIRIKIASVYARVPPKPGPSNHVQASNGVPLSGDAPWALSALPECLIQLSETTGPSHYVLAHLPSGAAPVTPPATLTYADCTISVVDDEAIVTRGADRFRIPPRVRFYRTGATLALLQVESNGMQLRVYEPVKK